MTPTDKQFYQDLGRRIAQYRKVQAMTQRQLAEALRISQQTIAHYECGRLRVSVAMLPPLANALDVTIEELLQTSLNTGKNKLGPASRLQKQVKQISQLPRAKQKFVCEMLDTVLHKTG